MEVLFKALVVIGLKAEVAHGKQPALRLIDLFP